MRCCVLAILLSFAVARACVGAEVMSNVVPAFHPARVRPAGPDEFVWILPSGNPTPYFEVINTASGEVLLVGEPGTYNVLWANVAAKSQGQSTITILEPGQPEPGPGPTPPNPDDPVAAKLFKVFSALNDKASAAKVLASVTKLQSELPTIKALQVASVRWRELNADLSLPQTWRPGIDALASELNGCRTVDDLAKVCHAAKLALTRAAK